ncbi:MAG: glutaminyl-tRNA synthase (glutamine-hydrolyzing) subunit B [Legionella sp. 40-6]|nr:MAG: glutaminyl-tRNA synthase (glutamine-hydrolyzing) subunit B [Legionella sp. 40-6]
MMWDTVIGLEVHVQLLTKSKLFSDSTHAFGALPNTQTSFIDAGFPGTLPVLNAAAVHMGIRFGLAVGATIQSESVFERKNYFYPDLPKGYQISQFQQPIVTDGFLSIRVGADEPQSIHIVRAHLEEDAGKSLHGVLPGYTGIDLNRAGSPLLEIVTAPCLHSAAQALAYLKTLHQLVMFLGICDGNMQEGSFRCDVNISLKPAGSPNLGVRTEIKNLNSFRFIEKAILFEQQRHQQILEQGGMLVPETRLYDADANCTRSMRNKEQEPDYRYFPDPDLLPLVLDTHLIDTIKQKMPPLPWEIREALLQTVELNADEIQFLLSHPATYSFYEEVKNHTTAPEKIIINWLKGIYASALNEEACDFSKPKIPAAVLGQLLDKVQTKKLLLNQARAVFHHLWTSNKSLEEIITEQGFDKEVLGKEQVWSLIQQLMLEFPEQAADYAAGKEKLSSFFIGQLMKRTQGHANPEQVGMMLREYLSTLK